MLSGSKNTSSKFEKSYESSWYHLEVATSAGYNNNCLQKIDVIVGVLHVKKKIPGKVANDLGELPSNSQGHH